MLDLSTIVGQGVGSYPAFCVKGAQSIEQRNLAVFSVIVKQLPWEAGNDMLDEVALYPSS